MLVLNLVATNRFLRSHPDSRRPMERWIEITEESEWQSILDVRQSFPAADAIKGTDLTCFDIAGNRYRLITVVSYVRQEVLIVELLTHAEYDRKY